MVTQPSNHTCIACKRALKTNGATCGKTHKEMVISFPLALLASHNCLSSAHHALLVSSVGTTFTLDHCWSILMDSNKWLELVDDLDLYKIEITEPAGSWPWAEIAQQMDYPFFSGLLHVMMKSTISVDNY
ncbi:hypothetical protein VP01_6286g1 [Puccinia sorghi]|uniref:Uncharacterized protein n=1 Tax=Puccinia sorghi TaxID=27349 RepID=A0A0L6UGF1_9BASI|nr:hypothetical protein VP01_6286g1 [Puccinia sorghi]